MLCPLVPFVRSGTVALVDPAAAALRVAVVVAPNLQSYRPTCDGAQVAADIQGGPEPSAARPFVRRRGRAPLPSSRLGEQAYPHRQCSCFCGGEPDRQVTEQGCHLRPSSLAPRLHLSPVLDGGGGACGEPSYKEVLLRRPDRPRGRRQSPTVEDSGAAVMHGEGWQVVKTKCLRLCSVVQSDSEAPQPEERRLLYLQRMKGLCFNCLARDHKVAACHNPTRCWRCRRFGHTSTECRPCSPDKPPSSLSNQNMEGTPTPPHNSSGTEATIDNSFILIRHSPPAAPERSLDPMLLEAGLMSKRCNIGLCPSTPSLAAAPVCAVNHHLPTEEVETPLLLRSEAEQLVGHELVKALGNFKQLMTSTSTPRQHTSSENKPRVVTSEGTQSSKSQKSINKVVHDLLAEQSAVPPSSLHSHQVNLVVSDPIVEHSVDTPTLSQHRRTKIKSRKPIVKVVRDMLTKKWIVVKKVKQLSIVGENGKLDEDKLQKYADHLKDLLPPNLLTALMRFKARDFWDIVVALSPHLG